MRNLALFILGLFILVGTSVADNDEAIPLAKTAATSWLQLSDESAYEATWTQASSYFQAAITLEDWTRAVRAARGPLQGLVSRELSSAEFHRELPGAPDGEYAVLVFNSAFDKKAKAVETVTVMKDGDAWRVSGYFIR